jgi:hypothetical protein
VNHATGLHVNGPVTLLVLLDATSAMFQGSGLCNGMPCTFELKVTDGGEPGRGRDKIQVTVQPHSPAEAVPERTIKNGNIQMHKPPGSP